MAIIKSMWQIGAEAIGQMPLSLREALHRSGLIFSLRFLISHQSGLLCRQYSWYYSWDNYSGILAFSLV